MLISLSWIRDFVDLPAGLDPKALAEKFTRTTAEVDGLHRVQVAAQGLIAAKVTALKGVESSPPTRGGAASSVETSSAKIDSRQLVTLDIGGGKSVETVSIAPRLTVGCQVVYAPVGASVAAFGRIAASKAAGHDSAGMILPGEALGVEKAVQEAVFLGAEFRPGDALPAELFDDFIIEVDNKSLTNRPDLWGHYGIAREMAAILRLPLAPYPVTPREELIGGSLPEISIKIADANVCRRYSAIAMTGVPTVPAPLWMQLRLGHVGQRPISGLVDLTNYIMMDLGQPMHAFDAAKVESIEVDFAKSGEKFKTLDGVERTLASDDLMIQCKGRSVALAGVMGGLETEVTPATSSLLLESANFDPVTVRKSARKLSLRSEASARFEKSLDPLHTVLGIQRFILLARAMYPSLKLTSRLSDAYPSPNAAVSVRVNPRHVARAVGREVRVAEAARLIGPLGFDVTNGEELWTVKIPSHRATGDCSIEADIIEEIARVVGYDSITPTLPTVSVRRFASNSLHELEQRTLEHFSTARNFHEIHGYLWDDAGWLAKLGFEPGPSVELRNPAAEGCHRLRRTLVPGLLAAVATNRFHFSSVELMEVGGVFEIASPADLEFRHLGLVLAKKGKREEDALYQQMKDALTGWSWRRFGRPIEFAPAVAASDRPWEHPHRTAEVRLDGSTAGLLSVVDLALRRRMDEHLSAWSVVWAELRLSGLEAIGAINEPLAAIPPFPFVELDFSIVVPRSERYTGVADKLRGLRGGLLKETRFVTSFEGDPLPKDRRSLTFRCVLGHDARTLTEEDLSAFRGAFESHATSCGYELRKS